MTAPVTEAQHISTPERARGSAGGAAPQSEHRTDRELLAEHIAGDPLALHTLLARHEVRMHWAERAAGVPESELADVHQEAVLKIHRCAGTFRNRSSVVTWMVTIAHRTALNFVTAQHRRGHRHREDISDCERDLPSTPAAPNQELSVDLHNALASIPILFRQTVVLRGMLGYSISEISTMLDVAPGTVKSRYSRGRRLLQDNLVLADYAEHP
ncbi:sigma-70 family RNA polymerase sigma factor [Corynebacterium sp.]|uniref:sigma-70 family RNA polymerase sigma factor n=1 Tax=Corynebacterium sp. TaxID=1720 RepID=UPI00261E8587|nr:sigma-70 family RNA polymerase sigma factor [Corynebacterium sp.]